MQDINNIRLSQRHLFMSLITTTIIKTLLLFIENWCHKIMLT